jgi:hypothetical protein
MFRRTTRRGAAGRRGSSRLHGVRDSMLAVRTAVGGYPGRWPRVRQSDSQFASEPGLGRRDSLRFCVGLNPLSP